MGLLLVVLTVCDGGEGGDGGYNCQPRASVVPSGEEGGDVDVLSLFVDTPNGMVAVVDDASPSRDGHAPASLVHKARRLGWGLDMRYI